jgi:NAD(P)-dependent dehydrogenase (short-subunit alcohol dehydrogenase family)
MNKNKTWLITGASQGLGLSLVKQLLQQDYNVAAISRSADHLRKAAGISSDRFLALQAAVTDEAGVGEAIEKAIDMFGSIDVVVNNAGYGLGGSIEELSDEETRANFDVNVFGTLNIIRKVMPYLRAQGAGHIFNISSIGGFSSIAGGWGIYAATKFAVFGFSEALATDVKPFGVKVTIVAPGAFRTNFLTPGSLVLAEHPIAEYQSVREIHKQYQQWDGNQPGDPEKATAAIIRMAGEDDPALYFFLGKDAWQRALKKNDSVMEDLKKWESVTTSMDY